MASEIFRAYAGIAVGVLVLAGLVLALLKYVLRRNVTSIWLTYRSWLVMTPVILGAVWGGRIAFIGLICALAIWGGWWHVVRCSQCAHFTRKMTLGLTQKKKAPRSGTTPPSP